MPQLAMQCINAIMASALAFKIFTVFINTIAMAQIFALDSNCKPLSMEMRVSFLCGYQSKCPTYNLKTRNIYGGSQCRVELPLWCIERNRTQLQATVTSQG